jgi:hypothetical protein
VPLESLGLALIGYQLSPCELVNGSGNESGKEFVSIADTTVVALHCIKVPTDWRYF